MTVDIRAVDTEGTPRGLKTPESMSANVYEWTFKLLLFRDNVANQHLL